MSKFTRLVVGDPHVKKVNLSDCANLMRFIAQQALERKVDRIDFLGDLFHTHAVKRLEVENFWSDALEELGDKLNFSVLILCGNHDMVGNKESEHINALNVYKYYKNVKIVNEPYVDKNGIGYLPYTSDKKKLIDQARDLYNQGAKKYLVAHETFIGAKFETGMYAPDGVDLDLIFQEQVESGHIHSTQNAGKCFYPGTPKWDTLSDANHQKGIWIITHNEDGSRESTEFISTEDIVTPITRIVVNEGDPEPVLKENAINYVELKGKTAWISKMKKKYKGRARIKATPVDRKSKRMNQNENTDINTFLEGYFEPIDGVSKKDVSDFIAERGLVQ